MDEYRILNLYACLGGNRYKWDEVLQAAQKAEPHVRNLIKNLIAQY